MQEWNDVYDENRQCTGRVHLRGTPWNSGDYGLIVCVWVYDGYGHILLTRRAKGKSFQGTWEIPAGRPRREKPAGRQLRVSCGRRPGSRQMRETSSSFTPKETRIPSTIFIA